MRRSFACWTALGGKNEPAFDQAAKKGGGKGEEDQYPRWCGKLPLAASRWGGSSSNQPRKEKKKRGKGGLYVICGEPKGHRFCRGFRKKRIRHFIGGWKRKQGGKRWPGNSPIPWGGGHALFPGDPKKGEKRGGWGGPAASNGPSRRRTFPAPGKKGVTKRPIVLPFLGEGKERGTLGPRKQPGPVKRMESAPAFLKKRKKKKGGEKRNVYFSLGNQRTCHTTATWPL